MAFDDLGSRICVACGSKFIPFISGDKACSLKCEAASRASQKPIDPGLKAQKFLAVFCRSAVARCIWNKFDRTSVVFGYTLEDLQAHLEKHLREGMSWENYGQMSESWSIDHSRPIASFPMTATIVEMYSLENLRPMWHLENCGKKDKFPKGNEIV